MSNPALRRTHAWFVSLVLLVALLWSAPSSAAGGVTHVAAPHASAAPRAKPVARATATVKTPTDFRGIAPEISATVTQQKASYLGIMLKGSLNVSRTKVIARRFMAPASVTDAEVPDMAEKNFRAAAAYLLDHVDAPLDLTTATRLNKMLTKGLVPESVIGQPGYRRSPKAFYKWLASDEAHELGRADPIALAERVHHEIGLLDAFPDGNGRTSRLMADLVLLKAGHAPALYTDMEDYFARGAPRAETSRESHLSYFREIVARGDVEAGRAAAGTTRAPNAPRLRRTTTGKQELVVSANP